MVETSKDEARKCTKTKTSTRRTMGAGEGVYARPHASAVRTRKSARR